MVRLTGFFVVITACYLNKEVAFESCGNLSSLVCLHLSCEHICHGRFETMEPWPPTGGHPLNLVAGAELTQSKVCERQQDQRKANYVYKIKNLALVLIRTLCTRILEQTTFSRNRFFRESRSRLLLRQKNSLKPKRSRLKTSFRHRIFANPLCDFLCDRCASFEISGNPEFCFFPYATSTGQQQNLQNTSSQDVAFIWENMEHAAKTRRIRRWCQPRSFIDKQADWMPPSTQIYPVGLPRRKALCGTPVPGNASAD